MMNFNDILLSEGNSKQCILTAPPGGSITQPLFPTTPKNFSNSLSPFIVSLDPTTSNFVLARVSAALAIASGTNIFTFGLPDRATAAEKKP